MVGGAVWGWVLILLNLVYIAICIMKKQYSTEAMLHYVCEEIKFPLFERIDATRDEHPKFHPHIYFIGRTPKITFDSYESKGDIYHFTFLFHSESGPQKQVFGWDSNGEANELHIKKNYDGSILYLNVNGGTLEISAFDFIVMMVGGSDIVFPFEVLYIGKAYGKNGEKCAFDRLNNHEKLIEILKENSPLKHFETRVALLEFKNYSLWFSEPKTVNRATATPAEEESHLDKLSRNLPENAVVSLIESALISVIKPKYNQNLKGDFPQEKHKSYKSITSSDYYSFLIELNIIGSGFELFSEHVNNQQVVNVRSKIRADASGVPFLEPVWIDENYTSKL
ncbi:MAG: hypothetical protein ACNI27_07165 [Desulfovibrio sp.]